MFLLEQVCIRKADEGRIVHRRLVDFVLGGVNFGIDVHGVDCHLHLLASSFHGDFSFEQHALGLGHGPIVEARPRANCDAYL